MFILGFFNILLLEISKHDEACACDRQNKKFFTINLELYNSVVGTLDFQITYHELELQYFWMSRNLLLN